MNVLIVYGTVEGHTKTIAEHIAAKLRLKGAVVSDVSAENADEYQPVDYDAVMVCAPVHIGRYPSSVVNYINKYKSQLAACATAFVSVSLGICSELVDERDEAAQFPETLFNKTGWRADSVLNIAGALKYLEYDFFKRWMMRRISKHEGGPTDTSKDHILTDWSELDSFVDEFCRKSTVLDSA